MTSGRKSDDQETVIGVDVGGTFTDIFLMSNSTRQISIAKIPSTAQDQSEGVLSGIKTVSGNVGEASTVVHGTTVGTNALLERKGACTGLITTAGFRDVLEMRRRDRPQTWGLWGSFEPIIPRNLRLEVAERTLADGTIRQKIVDAEIQAAAKKLLSAGCDSVVIFFINSYANDANELAALSELRAVWPNHYIQISSAILPEIREFERASTAALNAYLQPVMGSYLKQLESTLTCDGFSGQILIVQSNGGVMTVETACSLPVKTSLSGPAAGVIAGAYIAELAGFSKIITCDMGGTSFDVALVSNGRPTLAAQTEIDFGMVIRAPMIEMTTIGAGGGSIAWVDKGGLLQVGPRSAGSDPGPACYGLGSDEPTVTDANLVLGRINPDRPIGNKLNRLEVDSAKDAIKQHVAKPLNLDVMAAAEAVISVANAHMAGAIRLISIERGHDPAQFAAMLFGGGGPLHAGALINELSLAAAVVPRFPGVTSALGCVIADMRHDFVRTVNEMLDSIDADTLATSIDSFHIEGTALLDRAGVSFVARELIVELDMSYLGQTHTVSVPLPVKNNITSTTKKAIRTAFENHYLLVYGKLLDDIPIRVLNLRVATIGHRPKFDLSVFSPDKNATITDAKLGFREVWYKEHWQTAEVFDRLMLPVGACVRGPALFEQADATIFVDPGFVSEVDAWGNLIIRVYEDGS